MGRSFAPRLAADVTSLLSGCELASIGSGSGSSVALKDSEGDGICAHARDEVGLTESERGYCSNALHQGDQSPEAPAQPHCVRMLVAQCTRAWHARQARLLPMPRAGRWNQPVWLGEGGTDARRTASGIGVDVWSRFTARQMDLRYGCKSNLTSQHTSAECDARHTQHLRLHHLVLPVALLTPCCHADTSSDTSPCWRWVSDTSVHHDIRLLNMQLRTRNHLRKVGGKWHFSCF